MIATVKFKRPTLDELLQRIYRHYPRSVAEDHPRRRSGFEEGRRLVCTQEAAARACQWGFYQVPDDWRIALDPDVAQVVEALREWRPMAARWASDIPTIPLWDESNPWHDACYRYSALYPGYAPESPDEPDRVTVVVSILAPVYAICRRVDELGEPAQVQYEGFPEHYRDRISELSEYVERFFGFHRLDPATLLHPLPDVVPSHSNLPLGCAVVRDCLFSVE